MTDDYSVPRVDSACYFIMAMMSADIEAALREANLLLNPAPLPVRTDPLRHMDYNPWDGRAQDDFLGKQWGLLRDSGGPARE